MKVTQYRPSFVTGFDNATAYVTTLDQLLALDWIARWRRSALPGHEEELDPDFHRFSCSTFENSAEATRKATLVMAERKQGTEWWVIAVIDGDGRTLGLPQWVRTDRAATATGETQ